MSDLHEIASFALMATDLLLAGAAITLASLMAPFRGMK